MSDDLRNALRDTYNANGERRAAAESALARAGSLQGFTAGLLSVVADQTNTEMDVRAAAAIQLKNVCKREWEDKVPAGDKSSVLENLLQVCVIVSHQRRLLKIMSSVVQYVSKHSMSDWTQFVPGVLEGLSVDGSTLPMLMALKYAFKNFAHARDGPQKQTRDAMIRATFPHLLLVLEKLITSDISLSHAKMQTCILQIFEGTCARSPPDFLMSDVSALKRWFDCFLRIMSSQYAIHNENDASQKALKAKKRALTIVSLMFTRFGCPRAAAGSEPSSPEAVTFSPFFMECVAPPAVEIVLKTLENLVSSSGAPEDPTRKLIVQICFGFLSEAIEPSKTYKIIKPHLGAVVSRLVYGVLRMTPVELRTYIDEPEGYLVNNYSLMQEWNDPRFAASTFLLDLTKLRSMDSLDGTMEFFVSVLTNNDDPVGQEASLRALGGIAHRLMKPKRGDARANKYSNGLEELILNHVCPMVNDVANKPGWLRARACWTARQYIGMRVTSLSTYISMTRAILTCLDADPELVPKVSAAHALGALLQATDSKNKDPVVSSEALSDVETHLEGVIERLLAIMASVPNDDVVGALHSLIERYTHKMATYAPRLIASLVLAFARYSAEDDEDAEAQIAALNCLEAINSLCDAISEHPALLREVEPHVLPLLGRVIAPDTDLVENMEEGLRILSHLTWFGPVPYTEQVWSFCDTMLSCHESWAYDYTSDFALVWEHYIERQPRVLGIEKPALLARLIQMCVGVVSLTNGEYTEGDVRSAFRMLCSLFQSFAVADVRSGTVLDNEEAFKSIISIAAGYAFKELENPTDTYVDFSEHTDYFNEDRAHQRSDCVSRDIRCYAIMVIESAMLFDFKRTCVVFGDAELLRFLSGPWTDSLKDHALARHKKLAMTTCCSLLESASLIPLVLPKLALLSLQMESQIAEAKRRESRGVVEEEIDDDDEWEGDAMRNNAYREWDENDDAILESGEDEDLDEFTRRLIESGACEYLEDGIGEDEEDDGDASPLDAIDILFVVKEAFRTAMATQREAFQSAAAGCATEQKEEIARLAMA